MNLIILIQVFFPLFKNISIRYAYIFERTIKNQKKNACIIMLHML